MVEKIGRLILTSKEGTPPFHGSTGLQVQHALQQQADSFQLCHQGGSLPEKDRSHVIFNKIGGGAQRP